MNCRNCQHELKDVLVDLRNSPPSNSYLQENELNLPEINYPLKVFVCSNCFLVQVDEYKKSEAIFDNDYAYFSSYSSSWLAHCKKYTEMMCERFDLNSNQKVVEIASNDGYLLQYFKEKGIPVLGIEPTENTATVAEQKGIETITDFFGENLATQLSKEGKQADLLIGNNVLAHVPDILDFIAGMKVMLAPGGIITMEFPHLMNMIDFNQFDTIYHEHFSYLSFYTTQQIFRKYGLELFDVDEIETHGGSLRIYGKHIDDSSKEISPKVDALIQKELDRGINTLTYYRDFQERVLKIKLESLDFLISKKREGKKVAAYGAAAKGNTFINFCGIDDYLLKFVVDVNPNKQNKFLPGSHIPVLTEDAMKSEKPDFVVILPWNLEKEISSQLEYIKDWGGKFVKFIPGLEII